MTHHCNGCICAHCAHYGVLCPKIGSAAQCYGMSPGECADYVKVPASAH